MSDTIEQTPVANATDTQPSSPVGPVSAGWTRTHTITLLVFLSLVPGLGAAADRGWWHALPPAVRISAYVVSGLLILAACWLILVREQAPPDRQP